MEPSRPPTEFRDLNEVLAQWVLELQDLLDDQLRSVMLQGSFALDAADADSDVDFAVVVERELDAATVTRLQALHAKTFDRDVRWAKHLEGSYFPLNVLRDIDRTDDELWYLDNGARQLIRSGHCNSVVVRQTLREHGIVLQGSSPETLMPPIPWGAVAAEIRNTALTWGREILEAPDQWANAFYQGFIALNYCRMACDLAYESLGSKQRGATWAKHTLPTTWHGLLDRSWATRKDPAVSSRTPADPKDYAQTLDLLRLLLSQIEASPQG